MTQERNKTTAGKTAFRPEDCFSKLGHHTELGQVYYKLSMAFLSRVSTSGDPDTRQRVLAEFNAALREARLDGGENLQNARDQLTAYWNYAAKIAPHLEGTRDMLVPLFTSHLS